MFLPFFAVQIHLLDETILILYMLEYFLSPAKADPLPTEWGSPARSDRDPPGYRHGVCFLTIL